MSDFTSVTRSYPTATSESPRRNVLRSSKCQPASCGSFCAAAAAADALRQFESDSHAQQESNGLQIGPATHVRLRYCRQVRTWPSWYSERYRAQRFCHGHCRCNVGIYRTRFGCIRHGRCRLHCPEHALDQSATTARQRRQAHAQARPLIPRTMMVSRRCESDLELSAELRQLSAAQTPPPFNVSLQVPGIGSDDENT